MSDTDGKFLLPPETSAVPLGSTSRQDTASRCADIENAHLPLFRSKNLMYRSSCPVIINGMVGCATSLLICVAGVPSTTERYYH